MTLTIRYKDGEFTCTFTPDGDDSVQITGAGAVMAHMGDARPVDQGVKPGDENPVGDVEMIVLDQGKFSLGAEEDRVENEFDGSPATEPLVDASNVNNGDQQMNRGDDDTAKKVENTTSDREEDSEEVSTGVEKDRAKIKSNGSLPVPVTELRRAGQSAIYLGEYPRIRDHSKQPVPPQDGT